MIQLICKAYIFGVVMSIPINPGMGFNPVVNYNAAASMQNRETDTAGQAKQNDRLELSSPDSGRSPQHMLLPGKMLNAASETKAEKPHRQFDKLRHTLLNDLDLAISTLKKLPPAVTFFGSARMQPTDPCYLKARKIGSLMAEYGVPVSTGGGPGIMEFVPNGYLATGASKKTGDHHMLFHPVKEGLSHEASRQDRRSQGFSIKLPYEEEKNPSIEVATEFNDFTFRKFSLMENKRGYGFCPGGFGTLDELFEAWDISNRSSQKNPMGFLDANFWLPQFRALEKVASRERNLVSGPEMALVKRKSTDEPGEFINYIGSDKNPTGFKEDPDKLQQHLKDDINRACDAFESFPEAVTFIGSQRLFDDDITCVTAQNVACELSKAGIPLRIGDGGPVAKSVLAGAKEGNPDVKVDCFVMRDEELPEDTGGLNIAAPVENSIVHKSLIGRNISALIALPGDIHTLSELFGVLCMMQTGSIERKPIVLVGRDFWKPIFTAIKQTMLTDKRKLISKEDLELFTITDDPRQIRDAIMNREGSSHKTDG